MKMKKIIATITGMVMAVSMTACGNSQETTATEQNMGNSTTTKQVSSVTEESTQQIESP